MSAEKVSPLPTCIHENSMSELVPAHVGNTDLGSITLPFRVVNFSATPRLVGVSGGVGESTLATYLPGYISTNHTLVISQVNSTPTVLIARTTAYSLDRLIRVRSDLEKISGVNTWGVVFVADTPGKLPKQLKFRVRALEGAFANTWNIPYEDRWRFNDLDFELSKQTQNVISQLNDLAR